MILLILAIVLVFVWRNRLARAFLRIFGEPAMTTDSRGVLLGNSYYVFDGEVTDGDVVKLIGEEG